MYKLGNITALSYMNYSTYTCSTPVVPTYYIADSFALVSYTNNISFVYFPCIIIQISNYMNLMNDVF